MADARTLALSHATASAIKDSKKLTEFSSAISKKANEINEAKLITKAMLKDMANQIITFLEEISISELHDGSRQHLSKLISCIIQSPDNKHNNLLKREITKKFLADKLSRLDTIQKKLSIKKEPCNISTLTTEINNLNTAIAECLKPHQRPIIFCNLLIKNPLSHHSERQAALKAIKKAIGATQKEITSKTRKILETLIEDVNTYNKSSCFTQIRPLPRECNIDKIEDHIQSLEKEASQKNWNPCALFGSDARLTLAKHLSQHKQDLEELKKDTIQNITGDLRQCILHLKNHYGTSLVIKLGERLVAFEEATGSLSDDIQQNDATLTALPLRQ